MIAADKKNVKVSRETLLAHTIYETSRDFESGNFDRGIEMVLSIANVVENNHTSATLLRKFRDVVRKAKVGALMQNNESLFKKLSAMEKGIELEFRKSL